MIDGNLSIPNGRPFCYFAIANVIPLLSGRLDTPAGQDWLASEPLLACPDPPEALYMRLKRVVDGDQTIAEDAEPNLSKAEEIHD
ncbi:putative repeat protein (TIGR04076 family) [Subtercola frigoramans]|uniref:Repeat protein (TIGR04076 family) n=1 Tax=Subtercola frigoramans TaxID=120298 RepID=A0ABS2L7E4_9MICO|nr:putative repeat protein (TIGR04076 family) [Subtercola frigoramans]